MSVMSAASSQSSMGVSLRLALPCALDEVRSAARTVSAFLRDEGLHPEELIACELALTEACNNAVQYAGQSESQRPIEIRIFCNGSGVEFEVTDHTTGFEWPSEVKLPEADSERGRGLYIIHSLMDEVNYWRGSGANILLMRKRRCYQAHRLSVGAQDSSKDTRLKLSECQRAIKNMARELCFRSESLAAIFRCMAELGRTRNLEDFSYRLLNDLAIIAGADWFVLRLMSPSDSQLVAFASSESGGWQAPQTVPATGQTVRFIEPQAAVTGEDVWFDAHRPLVSDDPIQRVKPDSLGLVHPFFFGEALVGTLAVGRQNTRDHFTLEQVEVIHTFAEFLAIQVENTRLQEEHLRLRLVSRELEIARQMQRALLPKVLPRFQSFGLAAYYESARQVGGDFYDIVVWPDDSVCLFVADVMGKGVPAAMFAAILRSLVPAIVQWVRRPSDVLAQLNRLLFEELSRVDMFITAQVAVVNFSRREFTVASAGHCPVLLATASEEPLRAIATEGMPLGVLSQAKFHQRMVPLGAGSRLLLYTDGVTDACNDQGEHFGQQRLKSWLQQTTDRPATAQALKEELAAALARFESSAESRDDQTFLIMAEES